MNKLTVRGWRSRFADSYFGWSLASGIMLLVNELLDLILGHEVIEISWDLAYLWPVASLFGGAIFASVFSLFPKETQ